MYKERSTTQKQFCKQTPTKEPQIIETSPSCQDAMVQPSMPTCKKYNEANFYANKTDTSLEHEEMVEFFKDHETFQISVNEYPKVKYLAKCDSSSSIKFDQVPENGIFIQVKTSDFRFDLREKVDLDAICIGCPHTHYLKYREQTVMSIKNHAPALICWNKHVHLMEDKKKVMGSITNGICTHGIDLYDKHSKKHFAIRDNDSSWRRWVWCFKSMGCCCCFSACASKRDSGEVKLYDRTSKKETKIGSFENKEFEVQTESLKGMKQMVKSYDINLADVELTPEQKALVVGALISESWSNIDTQAHPVQNNNADLKPQKSSSSEIDVRM